MLSRAASRRRDMCHVESAVRRLMAITHAALDAPDQAMALFLQQGAALAAARMRRSSAGDDCRACVRSAMLMMSPSVTDIGLSGME